MNSRRMYPKGAKGKADRLFSLYIRALGRCQNCGATENLQTAHIISRRYSATRVDTANAFCLDAKCHMRFTDHPDEWMTFVDKTIGRAEYNRLKAKALTPTKVDWDVELVRLKALVPASS